MIKEFILANKHRAKPKRCKYSKTGFCCAQNVKECAAIDCSEGAIEGGDA